MSHEVPVIDATVAGDSSNSYATVAESDTYHGGHVNHATWSAANASKQKEALVHATRLLDEWVDWSGSKISLSQALRWPRYGVYDKDSYLLGTDVIPTFLVNATSELARVLIEGDTTGTPDTLGFSKLKVGPLEVEVDTSDRDRYGAIPKSVRVMIEPYGTLQNTGSSGVVTLLRS